MDHHLLVSELQALVVEAKRRHTDVREAGEKALEVIRGGAATQDTFIHDADTMLSPITLGCKTKTPKIIGIAITALQRLVALKGVPTSSLPTILQTLASVANQGVDIQLKILQALLSILTYNSDAHGDILGNALLLCFKLQDARVSVVSSTAAATLRQAVMLVFDRISLDASRNPDQAEGYTTSKLPTEPPTEISISPSCMDAYCIFSDLCLLTARSGSGSGSGLLSWGGGDKEKPKLLLLSSLQRTFGLELIESILSGYEESVKKRPELVHLLSHSLDPLLLKLLAEKPTFPIALRVCRLIFLLIRSFMEQLPKEVEVYLSTLIRLGMGEADEDGNKKEVVQPWFRVLALEIIRGICGDARLLQNLFSQYDQDGDPKLFAKLVSSLSRLTSEKPNLLGVSDQMHGLGVPTGEGSGPNAGYLDIGFGMVATAANVGVSTVSSMMGSQGGGLGAHSGLKLKLIEQHDKAEAPLIPETYIYLLALQSLDAVVSGIHASASRPDTTSPTLAGMAEAAWPALLAALSFIMATNLSDALFAEVLSALQEFTITCNILGLWMPRNAFLNTLGRYAVPPPVVSAMQTYLEGGSGRKESVISSDGLGITAALGVGGSTNPPSLSERNLACLKTTISTAKYLSADLDTAWHDVLEVLQNASFMLGAKRPSVTRRGTLANASPRIGSSPLRTRDSIDEPRSEVFEGIDTEDISIAINVLFDSTTQMDDKSFTTFIAALCQLSSEMIGVSAARPSTMETEEPGTPKSASFPMSPGPDNRRRTSGITISSSTKSGEKSFSLGKLRIVGMLNLSRLVNSETDVGWGVVTQHLLSIARHSNAPSTVRMQASDTLGELLLGSMRTAKHTRIQHLVFDVLGAQVSVEPVSNLISTDYDVRSAGYHTLNQVLESSGHSLEVGWSTIFSMLNDVCQNHKPSLTDPQSTHLSANRISAYTRGDANLVRIAFPSLNLICTDFLSSLDHDAVRQCMSCLGYFGRQKEDVNITLSAIGLMWNVSDAVQGQGQAQGDSKSGFDSKEIWLELLLQLLELGRDSRSEVRSTAMQTLFRCIELYGNSLSTSMWENIWWKVVNPLLESSKGTDSQVLALVSVGNIFHLCLDKLATLSSFEKLYTSLLAQVQVGFDTAEKQTSVASLKALERILLALQSATSSTSDKSTSSDLAIAAIWVTFTHMGETVGTKEGFTQESLVALVRIAELLHGQGQFPSELKATRQDDLSRVLRAVMIYPHSPEYRPDVDVMSPLQKSVFELTASSTRLRQSIVLSNLAWFTSLAFIGIGDPSHAAAPQPPSKRSTYIGLSKACMPRIPKLLRRKNPSELDVQTVLDVLGAYEAPIKLRYSCPPSCRFNDDPPLWRTAISSVIGVLEPVMQYSGEFPEAREPVWKRIVDIFEALLLADISPQTPADETFILSNLDRFRSLAISRLVSASAQLPQDLLERYTTILRQASILYHSDTSVIGGTTGGVVPVTSEKLAYWAFDLLVNTVDNGTSSQDQGRKDGASDGLARIALPTLLKRFETALRRYIDDVKIRGRVPLPQVRQDETMYVLRQLATLKLGGTGVQRSNSENEPLVEQHTSRAHLIRFYPLLLEISFLQHGVPSTWISPSEYDRLFTNVGPLQPGAANSEESADEYVEITGTDLSRRCLELTGKEMNQGFETSK